MNEQEIAKLLKQSHRDVIAPRSLLRHILSCVITPARLTRFGTKWSIVISAVFVILLLVGGALSQTPLDMTNEVLAMEIESLELEEAMEIESLELEEEVLMLELELLLDYDYEDIISY